MKIKSFESISGQRQLSRTQMKAVSAGKYPQPLDCSSECICNSGVSYNQGGSCACDGGYTLPCSVGTGDQ
ncbi:hypothetical protein MON38_10980 [Hymenobacter sp. DH14]|uniref:Uncharacterized protein n=1 Tax=Hymenobacter cyanobacteriorum TaxID=2926463 RepID=A0A9X2AIN8_9BACT|nr:hypothetical protein [Hymenobacter cyanobacteriorum]MCI1187944.1 hypothetical protein [Hymenobacter cyanobacteriorum]